MKSTKSSVFLFLCMACNPTLDENSANVGTDPNTVLASAKAPFILPFLDRHGGIDQWQAFKTLTFETGNENFSQKYAVDLATRKILIEGEKGQVGFDGENVWIAPSKEAFPTGGRPHRFMYSMAFYFLGIPYVYADPGVIASEPMKETFDGKTYDVVRVSYEVGVGDSSGDTYVNYFDPVTKELEFLLYTVTYHSGERNEDYYATIYDSWQTVDGMKVPKDISFAFIDEGKLNVYVKSSYKNVTFSKTTLNEDFFRRPEVSEIDPLKHYQDKGGVSALEVFSGTWVGEAKKSVDGVEVVEKVKRTGELAINGRWYEEHILINEGLENFIYNHSLISFDDENRSYQGSWQASNSPEQWLFQGKWLSANQFEFRTGELQFGDDILIAKTVYELVDENKLIVRNYEKFNSEEWVQVLTAEMIRQ